MLLSAQQEYIGWEHMRSISQRLSVFSPSVIWLCFVHLSPLFALLIPSVRFPGSIVAAILASDSDSGTNGEITYTLEEDDKDSTFLLNPVTGVFNVTQPLDYETQQYYILTAWAVDGGGQASSVRVYFNVLDVNDNWPVFNATAYSTSISENLTPGSSVLVVAASDTDDGETLDRT